MASRGEFGRPSSSLSITSKHASTTTTTSAGTGTSAFASGIKKLASFRPGGGGVHGHGHLPKPSISSIASVDGAAKGFSAQTGGSVSKPPVDGAKGGSGSGSGLASLRPQSRSGLPTLSATGAGRSKTPSSLGSRPTSRTETDHLATTRKGMTTKVSSSSPLAEGDPNTSERPSSKVVKPGEFSRAAPGTSTTTTRLQHGFRPQRPSSATTSRNSVVSGISVPSTLTRNRSTHMDTSSNADESTFLSEEDERSIVSGATGGAGGKLRKAQSMIPIFTSAASKDAGEGNEGDGSRIEVLERGADGEVKGGVEDSVGADQKDGTIRASSTTSSSRVQRKPSRLFELACEWEYQSQSQPQPQPQPQPGSTTTATAKASKSQSSTTVPVSTKIAVESSPGRTARAGKNQQNASSSPPARKVGGTATSGSRERQPARNITSPKKGTEKETSSASSRPNPTNSNGAVTTTPGKRTAVGRPKTTTTPLATPTSRSKTKRETRPNTTTGTKSGANPLPGLPSRKDLSYLSPPASASASSQLSPGRDRDRSDELEISLDGIEGIDLSALRKSRSRETTSGSRSSTGKSREREREREKSKDGGGGGKIRASGPGAATRVARAVLLSSGMMGVGVVGRGSGSAVAAGAKKEKDVKGGKEARSGSARGTLLPSIHLRTEEGGGSGDGAGGLVSPSPRSGTERPSSLTSKVISDPTTSPSAAFEGPSGGGGGDPDESSSFEISMIADTSGVDLLRASTASASMLLEISSPPNSGPSRPSFSSQKQQASSSSSPLSPLDSSPATTTGSPVLRTPMPREKDKMIKLRRMAGNNDRRSMRGTSLSPLAAFLSGGKVKVRGEDEDEGDVRDDDEEVEEGEEGSPFQTERLGGGEDDDDEEGGHRREESLLTDRDDEDTMEMKMEMSQVINTGLTPALVGGRRTVDHLGLRSGSGSAVGASGVAVGRSLLMPVPARDGRRESLAVDGGGDLLGPGDGDGRLAAMEELKKREAKREEEIDALRKELEASRNATETLRSLVQSQTKAINTLQQTSEEEKAELEEELAAVREEAERLQELRSAAPTSPPPPPPAPRPIPGPDPKELEIRNRLQQEVFNLHCEDAAQRWDGVAREARSERDRVRGDMEVLASIEQSLLAWRGAVDFAAVATSRFARPGVDVNVNRVDVSDAPNVGVAND